MKNFYILFLIISIQIVKSQDTTFNILNHSYPATSSIYAMDKLDSSYYLLIIQMDTPNYYQHVNYGIIKLNSNFKTIDSSIIDINRTIVANRGRGFILDNDTTITFCGSIKYDNNQKQNGYIAKFNKDLDTIWTKQIMHPDTAYADTAQIPWTSLRDMKITPEGNYLIVGNYNHHCQGNMDNSFIIKMDTSGNILWFKFLDPNIYQTYITNIEIDPVDSGFYFISSKVNFYIYKYNKDGDFVWSKQFYTGNKLSWVTDIKLIQNNIVIGLTYIAYFEDDPRLQVISLNKNSHSINWIKIFKSISIESKYLRQEVIDIEEMPNGNIAVGSVGMKYLDSTFYPDVRANLLMLSPNGDSLWSHYYTYQNDSLDVEDMQFNDMVVCDDSGILFGGFYISKQDYITRPWLVKTDSLGNAPGMFTVGIEEDELVIKNYELRIYPNPTSDIVNLSIEETTKRDLQLEVYNISGQLVLEK